MIRDDVLKLLEPVVEAMGYGLVDVDLQQGLLRLYIESDAGITLDDCEKVSRQVSAVLDVEDPIPEKFTLEVSSPGVNRILRTRAHFDGHTGEFIKVKMSSKRDGRLRFQGTLARLEGDDIVLDVDGEQVQLPISGIDRARVSPR